MYEILFREKLITYTVDNSKVLCQQCLHFSFKTQDDTRSICVLFVCRLLYFYGQFCGKLGRYGHDPEWDFQPWQQGALLHILVSYVWTESWDTQCIHQQQVQYQKHSYLVQFYGLQFMKTLSFPGPPIAVGRSLAR